MQRNPAVRSLDFLAGMVAYEVYLSCKDIRLKPFLKHLLELAVLLAYLLAFSRVLSPWTHRALVILTLILFALTVKGFLVRGLESKPLLFLGKISFSLYIIHEVVIEVFIEIIPLPLNPYVFALFMYAVTVGLSYLSSRYVEPWGRDRFLRLVPASLRQNQ